MQRRILGLLLALVIGVVAGAWIGWTLQGWRGLQAAGLSAALCVVPGFAFIALAISLRGSAVVLGVLAGSVVRLLTVGLGVLVATQISPELIAAGFPLWCVGYYLYLLLLETLFVVWSIQSQPAGSKAS